MMIVMLKWEGTALNCCKYGRRPPRMSAEVYSVQTGQFSKIPEGQTESQTHNSIKETCYGFYWVIVLRVDRLVSLVDSDRQQNLYDLCTYFGGLRWICF